LDENEIDQDDPLKEENEMFSEEAESKKSYLIVVQNARPLAKSTIDW
jgi:hypothetical protein